MEVTFKIIASLILLIYFVSELTFFKWYILKRDININRWSKVGIIATTIGAFLVATLYANLIDILNIEDLSPFNTNQSIILGVYLTVTFASSLVYILYLKRLKLTIDDGYITKYLGRYMLAKISSILLVMAFIKIMFV